MRSDSRELWLAGLTLAGLALAAGPLMAHHGATEFDRSKPMEISGVVREFRWTSPHAWILLDVPAGQTTGASAAPDQWALEGTSITVMVRNGWKSNSLRPGDHVRVLTAPRRDGTHGGEFLSVTLTETGKVLRLGSY